MLEFFTECFIPLALIVGAGFVLAFDTHVARQKKNLFIAILVITLLLAAVSYADNLAVAMDSPPVFRVLFNIAGFGLRPIVILLFIRLAVDLSRSYMVLTSLSVVNILIYCTAFVNGFAFSVNENNVLVRGPLWFTSNILCAIYLLVLIITAFREFGDAKKGKSGVIVIFAAAVLIIAGVFDTQITNTPLINTAIVAAAILYYFYLHIRYVNESFLEQEERMKLQQIALHVSQLKPHFLYNTLNTIYFLCDKNPKVAQEAISRFSDYLRQNLDSLEKYDLIPFTNELEHVDTYLWIEKLRFEERLNIEYDIQATAFRLPMLSLQPIVENAVKHGVCARPDGGTIYIRSYETETAYEISVEDDGVGFDTREQFEPGVSHNGIRNVKGRLEDMCGGDFVITSVPGEGTKAVLIIPKQDKSPEADK